VEDEDQLAMFTNATEGIRPFSAASFTYIKCMSEMFSERSDSSPFRRDPNSQCLQSTVEMCLYVVEKREFRKKIRWEFDNSSQPQVQPLITGVDSKF
jgi:hypothetical protein